MKYHCTKCKQPVAEQVTIDDMPILQAVNGAELSFRQNEATRCVCKCGKKMVLLKGSVM